MTRTVAMNALVIVIVNIIFIVSLKVLQKKRSVGHCVCFFAEICTMTVVLQSPRLLTLTLEGFSSPDPELTSLDKNLNKRECRVSDDETKRGNGNYFSCIGNRHYDNILLSTPAINQ